MIQVYYYLVFVSALVSLLVAAAVFWKNRYQAVGPIFGITMVGTALWLFCFAKYFQPLTRTDALMWARLTMTTSIFINPLLFHSMCALVERTRRFRWWIVTGYVMAAMFAVLLMRGQIITGFKPTPFMNHYVVYNRVWYPLLGLHIVGWQLLGVGILAYHAVRLTGYRRTQLVYFMVAWFVVFLVTNSIILPLEYDINIQPFGFFFLPLNLALLAYVMSKARLADFNVVIARVLLYALTLLIVIIFSLIFVGGMAFIAPGFMNPQQILFTMTLVVTIGLGLTIVLPRWLPRAERMMQERWFGKRYGYQDAVAGVVKELGRMPTIDLVLGRVANTIHSVMQVTRVVIATQDPLSGDYLLQAQSGLTPKEAGEVGDLKGASAIVHWFESHPGVLVSEEVVRQMPEAEWKILSAELERMKAVVCVPMMLEDRLTGLIFLGPKVGGEMYFISDLKLLETLATEVAMAIKYRRMEEEVLRKNKLVELGTIAAGVAHEIRNPLASIRTFAQLMPDRMDDPEFKNEFSKLVLKDVDRITKVIESMLAFARPAQVTIGDHLANDLVDEALLLVQPRLKSKRIDLRKQYHGNPTLKVDKNQIIQVLVNLLNNATDVLPEQGRIRVATGVQSLDLDSDGNGSNPQQYAVIEVADNGQGIPAAVRNRLFDPFFTTKKDGTGLGLSISQKIVRDHGGIIPVNSIEGKGTTFQINLPLQ